MLIAMQAYGMYSTKLIVPFFKQFHPDLVVGSWSTIRISGRWRSCRLSLLWCS